MILKVIRKIDTPTEWVKSFVAKTKETQSCMHTYLWLVCQVGWELHCYRRTDQLYMSPDPYKMLKQDISVILAVVFAFHKLHQFMYGKKYRSNLTTWHMHNHKILKKSLSAAPPLLA